MLTPRRVAVGLAVTLVVAGAAASGSEPAVAAERISVFPSPGTRFASARTQISFRGVSSAQLGSVRVLGSRSGTHAGRLRDHSDGAGASFLPNKRFREGERVEVHVRPAAGDAGDVDSHFTVARTPARPPPPAFNAPLKKEGEHDVQHFRSRPDLLPPNYRILTRSTATAPGHIFLAPKKWRGQNGPMILDERGRLVYFQPVPRAERAADLRVQRYLGAPVITWWEGVIRGGEGTGEGVIVDSSYREVARVRAGNGYEADLHEFAITPRDTAMMLIYSPAYQRLPSARGRRGRRALVTDGIVQEIDIRTGLVLYEWHSLGNVGAEESHFRRPESPRASWDYFHANAVSEDTDGNLLVTARHTWSIYKLSRTTGSIIWRLGGRNSDFKMRPGTRFAWPHDGHREADGSISVFDNAASPPVRKRSRALAITLDDRERVASLSRSIEHPAGLLSPHQGNANTLPNGNVFVGWGGQRWFSEFAPDGRLLFDGRLAKGNDSYRAYRSEWTARPATRPRVAVRSAGDGRVELYASWNGATEVARWQVVAGPHPDSLTPVGSRAWGGFETRIRVTTGERFLAARALDAEGRVLGTSVAKRL